MGGFFVTFLLLLATGVPIALALGVGGTAYLFLSGNGGLVLALPQRMMAATRLPVMRRMPATRTAPRRSRVMPRPPTTTWCWAVAPVLTWT